MKKIVSIFAIAALFGLVTAGVAIAQSSDSPFTIDEDTVDISTQIIKVEDKYADQHPSAKNVSIELEYTPLTGEVRLFYTCTQASYDQGEAMNTAIAVYEDFASEYKYRKYTYKAKDKTKNFKDGRNIRMTTYISNVIFTR